MDLGRIARNLNIPTRERRQEKQSLLIELAKSQFGRAAHTAPYSTDKIKKILGKRFQEALDNINDLVHILDIDAHPEIYHLQEFPVSPTALIPVKRSGEDTDFMLMVAIKSASHEKRDRFKRHIFEKLHIGVKGGTGIIPFDNRNDERNNLAIEYRFNEFVAMCNELVLKGEMQPWTEEQMWAIHDLFSHQLQGLSIIMIRAHGINADDAAKKIEHEILNLPELTPKEYMRAVLLEGTLRQRMGDALSDTAKKVNDALPESLHPITQPITGGALVLGRELAGPKLEN